MDTLIHNNLRCMYYGVFSQAMADEFISRHLLNPDEFLTPVPLPSIAANDPLFRNIPDNNWGGQPQGLTWQRAIRALENYGHYAELTMLGRKILQAIKNAGVFTQQHDPFDIDNPVKDDNKGRHEGYGPTILAFLEYVARFFGVHIELDQVFWSGLADGGETEYVQIFGARSFVLRNDGRTFTGMINGEEKFTCSAGVRVCSDMDGNPTKIIGIDTVERLISFRSPAGSYSMEVKPNQIISLEKGLVAQHI